MPEGIPSIAEGVAAALPAVIAANPPAQPGQQSQQTQQKQEANKTDATTTSTTSASTETRKSLSESLPEPGAEKAEVKEPPAEHEDVEFKRQDGENDSKFIKRLKSELAAARKASAERSEPKRTEPDADVVKQLQEQLSERERTLEQTAYEKSRKFQESHVKPIERAEKSARDLISKFTDAKGVYERAMALDGKAQMEFLKEHAEEGAGAIFDRLQRINELRGDRDEALKSYGEQAKELVRQQQEQETQALSKDFDGTFDKISKSIDGLRGDKADALKEEAFGLLDGSASREDVLSAAPLAVWAVRVAIPEMAAMQKELTTLRARVAERQQDGATINGRGADTTGSDRASNFDAKGKPLPMQQVITRNVAEVLQKR